MVRHTLKIFQQTLQDFQSVSDHFGTLCIKGLALAPDWTILYKNAAFSILVLSTEKVFIFHKIYLKLKSQTRSKLPVVVT